MLCAQGGFFITLTQTKRKETHCMLKIKNTLKRFVSERKAEGFLDVAMKILIVVVIGAAILLILNAAMPDLFQNLINKISGELTGVNVLP